MYYLYIWVAKLQIFFDLIKLLCLFLLFRDKMGPFAKFLLHDLS